MDIHLDGPLDGIETAKRLRFECDTAIVYLTAHTAQDMFERAKATQPYAYLTKPIAPLELVRTIEVALFKHAMERNLREQEEKYRALFQASWDGIILFAEDSTIVDANATAQNIFGYTLEELQGLNIQDLIHPDDLRETPFKFQAIVAGRPQVLERRIRRKDGTYVLLEVRASALGNGMVQAVYRDISEQRRMERDLRESERRYRVLTEGFPNGALFLVDRNLHYLFCGGKGLEQVGLRKEDLIGKRPSEVFPPEVSGPAEEHCRRVFEGRAGRYEVHYRGRIYDNHAVPVIRDDGIIAEGIVITQEITDRKKAEIALRERENLLQTILKSSPVGIALMRDGRLEWVNEAFCRLFGFASRQDCSGTEAERVFAKQEDYARIAGAKERLQGEDIQELVTQCRRKTGSLFDARIMFEAIDPQALDHGVILCVNDVTEFRKAEQMAVRGERLKAVAELSTGVAHNFNNLLQIVFGGSQLALADLELGDVKGARANLLRIVETANFGAQTVKRLQNFARTRTDDAKPLHKVFDLAETAAQAIEMSKPWWKTAPETNGIHIALNRYCRKGCMVKGNENEIFEVIVNLIKNAAEALPKGGEIRIRTSWDDSNSVLVVEDNGIGIAEEDLARIFEPFWTTKGFHGTGMGLASSLGIIRAHEGDLMARSRAGEGSTFTVELPYCRDPVAQRPSAEVHTVGFRATILVVDDMPAVTRQLEAGLSRYGQTVVTASSGQQALEIIGETSIDAVVCDLAMPHMNGWQVAGRIVDSARERECARPAFILLTGWSGEITEEAKTQASGVDRILEKPVDMRHLLDVLGELLQHESHAGSSIRASHT
jgi:PAS domain S-box-containing protein